jgi:hypothetical protein
MRYDSLGHFEIPHNFENPYRRETTSRMEVRLFKVFRDSGIKVFKHDKCPIKGLHQAVDWTAISDDGREVHIEVDGKTHFNDVIRPSVYQKMNPSPNGNTLFRNSRLRQEGRGQTILRIPYTLCDIMLNEGSTKLTIDQRSAMAHGYVNLAARAKPDVYQATLGAPAGQPIMQIHSRLPVSAIA